MDRMLIAVFERESEASAVAGVMNNLSEENLLLIYALAVIVKDFGKVSVADFKIKDCRDPVLEIPTRSLIKLLVAAYDSVDDGNARAFADKMIELAEAGVDSTFLDQVAHHLVLGRAAIVSEVEEETPNAMDRLVESQGGTVFRCGRRESMDVQIAKELDALHSEIQTLEKRMLERPEESKSQLQPKLDQARAKFGATKDRAKQHAASIRREAEAKICLLQERTAKANPPSKARLEKLADEIRVDYVNRATKLNLAWQFAGDLVVACFLFFVLN
jgi:uncharacterized membrane protein